jgi:excinuclease ABC subunit C
MVLTRHVTPDRARYFGPFTRVKDLRRVVRTLRAVFRLRNCTDRRLARGGRECLQYFIHRCTAPCTERVNAESYAEQVQPLLDLLSGRGEDVIAMLDARMRAHAADLRFEESARLRDEIAMLRDLLQEQWLTPPVEAEADVVGLAARGDLACGLFLHVREGKVLGKSHRLLTGTEGRERVELMRSLLLMSLLHATRVPARLILPEMPAEADEVRQALERAGGHGVRFEAPSRGPLARLIDLAARNAHLVLEEEELRAAAKKERVDRSVYALQETLGLARPPYRIEGFDISNTRGAHTVASMVVFRDGLAWKSGYRRFRMRREDGPNDFAMMEEVLRRRLRRLAAGEGPSPDLILVDGGKGQVSAARRVLSELGFPELPLAGLAKREEEIVLPAREASLRLPRGSGALRLLQRVRDEAHRFAVTYHRTLRAGGQSASRLDAVRGIGPARRRLLLRRFGSVSAMRAAGPQGIAEVPGIGPSLARAIWSALGVKEKR